jgi:hypothetical protein
MGAPFRSGHLLPPHNEYFSFAESITQRRTVKKMGWSDGYVGRAQFTGEALPEDQKYADVVRVCDVRGKDLRLYSDILAQEMICFFNK